MRKASDLVEIFFIVTRSLILMSSSRDFNSPSLDNMPSRSNRKWQIYPKDVIPMWQASPDFPIAPEIKKSLHEAVDNEKLYYASDHTTKQAIVEKVKRVNRIELELENVMITQGVEPALWLSIRQSCNRGDEVIIPDPMYNGVLHAVKNLGAKPVYWELNFDEGYPFDEEKLKKNVTKKTRLICLCNPHNPVGRVMTIEELKSVADIAVDKNIQVFIDELWEDIKFDGREHVSLASLNPEIDALTMTAWGISKTFGVAGLYFGYLGSGNKELVERYRKEAICCGARARGTNTLARAVAPVMLDETLDWWRHDLIKHLTIIREICFTRINEISGVEFPKIEGTYMAFPRFNTGMSCKKLHEFLLKEAKVGLSPGDDFGPSGEKHMRICLATSEAIMEEAINRLERTLTKIL